MNTTITNTNLFMIASLRNLLNLSEEVAEEKGRDIANKYIADELKDLMLYIDTIHYEELINDVENFKVREEGCIK